MRTIYKDEVGAGWAVSLGLFRSSTFERLTRFSAGPSVR
jgi:hypothetical protein